MIFFFLFLSLIYITVKVYSFTLWRHRTIRKNNQDVVRPLSILVIARDEEELIKACLSSIVANQYPSESYEIILVDDHSSDRTVAYAESLNIQNLRVVRLSEYIREDDRVAYKKAAQKLGVQLANNEVILQTDADCIVPEHWIRTMMTYLNGHRFVTGPIKITGKGFLSLWQLYDGLLTVIGTFTGIQKRWWYSSNAGNMAFHKADFLNFIAEGYSPGASGDDMFFVNYLASQKYDVAFANEKSAVVTTQAEPTFRSLFQQRLRWASKTTAYNKNGIQILMGFVFLFYLILVLLITAIPFLSTQLLMILLAGVVIKWITDLLLLTYSSGFYDENYSLGLSPFFSIAHMAYVVVIGCAGLIVKSYQWKGRQVR